MTRRNRMRRVHSRPEVFKPTFASALSLVLLLPIFLVNTAAGKNQIVVKVTSPSPFARENETIALSWQMLMVKHPTLDANRIIITERTAQNMM